MAQRNREAARYNADLLAVGEFIIEIASKIKVLCLICCRRTHVQRLLVRFVPHSIPQTRARYPVRNCKLFCRRTRRSTSACAPVVPLCKKDGRPLVPSQQAPGLIGRSHAGGAQVVLTAGVKRDIYCNHRLLPKRRQIQTKSAQPSTQPHGYTPPMRDTRSTPVTAWVQGSARQI